MDYPRDRLQILVASDGSPDGTDDIVASYASRGVLLLSLPRRGKIRTLNAAVERATGKILVFTDANTRFEPGADIRAKVTIFADGGYAASINGRAQGYRRKRTGPEVQVRVFPDEKDPLEFVRKHAA